MRPLVIGRFENPRAFKHIVKDNLPVIYRANSKSWMTKHLFMDWFKSYFCPAVESYLKRKNLDCKALLMIDNAPGHGSIEELENLHPTIKIKFLPANTTSILQPMDQGVISTFKKLYLKKSFAKLRECLKCDMSVEQFWKNFTVKDAIDHIASAWNEVTDQNLKGVWNNLLTDRSISLKNHGDTCDAETDLVAEIVEIGQILGFNELDAANVLECVNEAPTLDVETLIEIDKFNANQTDSEDSEPEELEPKVVDITNSEIEKMLSMIDQLDQILLKDSNMDRAMKCRMSLNNFQCYKELLVERKKKTRQTNLFSYFSKE